MSSAAPPAPLVRAVPPGSRERQAQIALFPPTQEGGQPTLGIVKHSRHGLIRNVLARIRLRAEADEVWTMHRWNPRTRQQEPVHSITAAGYDRLNQHAGVTFITPPTLTDDGGIERSNPYLDRDERTREILCVRIRMVGMGRSALGNLVAHDYTLSYDLGTYLAQDVWSRWTGRKSDSVKSWGRVIAGGIDPACEPHEKAYRIPAGVTLVVDLRHKDVLAILSEHISRQKFAERSAITICQRNILKKFLGASRLDANLTVGVVAWAQADRDLVELGDMVSRANSGELLVDNEAISIERTAEAVGDKDQVDEALHGDLDEEQAAAEPPPEPHTAGVDAPAASPPAGGDDAQCAELRAKIRDVVAALGDEASAVLVDFEISSLGQITTITDPAQLNEIEDALTAKRLRLAQAKAKRKSATATATAKSEKKAAGSLLPDDAPAKGGRTTGDSF